MRRWKCVLPWVALLLFSCAGGSAAVREGATGDAASVEQVEGSTFVEGATEEGDGVLPGAFLPEGWEHAVWGAGEDPLEGAVATRPVRRGGTRPVRQPPLLATPRPTPLQAQLRTQRTANQVVVLQARQLYFQRLKQAQAKYPNSSGYENHHLIPKYLGGPKNGQTYRLPTAYHKAVTQEFRQRWSYGQPPPDPQQLQKIMIRVYAKYPIPQLVGITP